MGFSVQFDNGHSVEFDTQPSEADIDEAYAHTKTLPVSAVEAPAKKAGYGTAINQHLLVLVILWILPPLRLQG